MFSGILYYSPYKCQAFVSVSGFFIKFSAIWQTGNNIHCIQVGKLEFHLLATSAHQHSVIGVTVLEILSACCSTLGGYDQVIFVDMEGHPDLSKIRYKNYVIKYFVILTWTIYRKL